VTHVAADTIAVIAMNALFSVISEYKCNKAITSNAKKITFRTARQGVVVRAQEHQQHQIESMSVAHITRAVPNIRFMTRLPFTATNTAG